jgi:hypothetical protein
MGERSQAGYLRALALSVGMDALAARLDPDQFAPGAIEQMVQTMITAGRRPG